MKRKKDRYTTSRIRLTECTGRVSKDEADSGVESNVGRVISSTVLMLDGAASAQSLQIRRGEHMEILL